jgi:hypothetical protein
LKKEGYNFHHSKEGRKQSFPLFEDSRKAAGVPAGNWKAQREIFRKTQYPIWDRNRELKKKKSEGTWYLVSPFFE